MTMEENARNRLAELEAKIASLPAEQRAQLEHLLEETKERHADIKSNVDTAREALDDWRLLMKYNVFDVEAGRRESSQH